MITLVRRKEFVLEDLKGSAKPLIVVLDGVQDPGNAGAIVRAAEAFGATGVVFLKGTVNPYNPKCLRGSAGSVFRVPLVQGRRGWNLVDFRRANANRLHAADAAGSDDAWSECDLTAPCAMIIGSEAHGVSKC